MQLYKKPLIYSFLSFFLGLSLNLSAQNLNSCAVIEILPKQAHLTAPKIPAECTKVILHIIVHGTYEITNAMRNPIKVYFDKDLTNSAHEKAVRGFCRMQLQKAFDHVIIYQEGLFRLNPTAEDAHIAFDQMAIWPFLQGYKKLQELPEVSGHEPTVHHIYYSFGWSGLLSQNSRRLAAMAFYNALISEKAVLTKVLADQGLPPEALETVVLAHSHGGNIALNLSWFDQSINLTPVFNAYSNCGEEETLKKIFPAWKRLSERLNDEQFKTHLEQSKYKMDQWLYKPEQEALSGLKGPLVKTLLMFGTPIQPETFPLIFTTTFGKVINLYSTGDNVQNNDSFSTWKRQSERTVSGKVLTKIKPFNSPEFRLNNLQQVRMILAPKKDFANIEEGEKKANLGNLNLMAILSDQSGLFHSQGPSHLEYWTIFWQTYSDRLYIRPLPIATISPWILRYAKDEQTFFIDQDSCSDELMFKEQDPANLEAKTLATMSKQTLFEIKKSFFAHKHNLKPSTWSPEKTGAGESFASKLNKYFLTS